MPTPEEEAKAKAEAEAKAKAEAEAKADAEAEAKRSRRRARETEIDIGAELADLEKKFDQKIAEISKQTGISKYLIYVPVGLLFLFAIVVPVLNFVGAKMKERANAG